MPDIRQNIYSSKIAYFSSRGGLDGKFAVNSPDKLFNNWYLPSLEEDEEFQKQVEDFYNEQNSRTDNT